MKCELCGNEIYHRTESHDVDGAAIEGKEYEAGHDVECPDYKKLL